jgi:hypothetical protein
MKIEKLATLVIVTMMAAVLFAGLAEAGVTGNRGLSRLVAAPSGFLPDHYDQRSGTFDPDSAGTFDDGADVVLTGKIPGIGKATVEASAAWDWGTYLSNHPSAAVYNKAITMPKDHQHANCKITVATTHTFTAMVKITDEDGDEINADIIGGVNNERLIVSAPAHSPDCAIAGGTFDGRPNNYDAVHSETENEVLINFSITDGTGKFEGATGGGVLQFVYDTMEPHNLLEAGIILNLD